MFHKFRLFLLKLLKGVPKEDVPDVPKTKFIEIMPKYTYIKAEVVTSAVLDLKDRSKNKILDMAEEQIVQNISAQIKPYVYFKDRFDPCFGTYVVQGILAVDKIRESGGI